MLAACGDLHRTCIRRPGQPLSIRRRRLRRDNVVLAAAFPPGDYNENGFVDAADYVVWRNDPNRTQGQYTTWRTNFGRTAGAGSWSAAARAVPEAAAAALLPLALGLLISRQVVGTRRDVTRPKPNHSAGCSFGLRAF
jgi:hypothetical protein